MSRILRAMSISLAVLGLAGTAHAEVDAATPDHYTLHHEAYSPLPAESVWDRLVQPETWWVDAHTYSGEAGNLSLDDVAGGYWREDWDGNSVVHGTVLTVMPGQMLRLDAPFGPLQGMAVTVIWTITLDAQDDGGTTVTFHEVANGSMESGLDQIAPAVDGVKAEAMARLVAEATPSPP